MNHVVERYPGNTPIHAVDGEPAHLLWPPYRAAIDPGLLRPGRNRLEVVVTNSAANHYEGTDRPSGLFGPVTLDYEVGGAAARLT
ncbi:MAG: hypothetical protein LBR33_01140 [Propionibacteriaceae bacterium]|jgi:hypothetical protein|nr:hypothetical protein [Propionibacteriaceae bacterium]